MKLILPLLLIVAGCSTDQPKPNQPIWWYGSAESPEKVVWLIGNQSPITNKIVSFKSQAGQPVKTYATNGKENSTTNLTILRK